MANSDVPISAPDPRVDNDGGPTSPSQAFEIYTGLVQLTLNLDSYLKPLYRIDCKAHTLEPTTSNSVKVWIESSKGIVRHIAIRGSDLSQPGAANLRLAVLCVQFLHHRIALETRRTASTLDYVDLKDYYIQTRRSAEEVVLFIQELVGEQLLDFWMPTLAFPLLSMMTFLIRSSVELEEASIATGENVAFNLARTMMAHLRSHRNEYAWDIAELCYVHYHDVLEELGRNGSSTNFDLVDAQTIDALFAEMISDDVGLYPPPHLTND